MEEEIPTRRTHEQLDPHLQQIASPLQIKRPRTAVAHTVTPQPPIGGGDASGNAAPRTMHAAMMLVVVIATLLLGAVFNADALVRDTKAMPYGHDRDLWLAVWAPFHGVSNALRLDKPRAAVDEVTGRGGGSSDPPELPLVRVDDDEAPTPVVAIVPPSPTAIAPAAASPTPEPAVRIPSPSEPLRLWIGGDSLAGIFGQSLVRIASDTGVIDATLDYRISTGLARADYFDWPGQLQRVNAEIDPDVMVLVFGSNDSQGLLTPAGNVYQPLSDGWRAEYRRRVAATMELVSRPGRLIMWVGLPPMRDGEFSAKLADIDQIYRQEAASHAGVAYVDATQILSQDGTYSAYLDDGAGHVELVRESDGVHLTRAGGDRLAGAVLYEIGSVVPLSPSVLAQR